jgi:hypothetical protein
MLMAVYLAEKLGPKGLLAYSLHPGVIITTGLTRGVPFEEMAPELSTNTSSIPIAVNADM